VRILVVGRNPVNSRITAEPASRKHAAPASAIPVFFVLPRGVSAETAAALLRELVERHKAEGDGAAGNTVRKGSRHLLNKVSDPKISTLRALAKALGVQVEELVAGGTPQS
jgi:hypothetical protein